MQLDRWLRFSKKEQIGAVAAEILRAQIWQKKDKDKFISALERALELIDLTIEDKRWKQEYLMIFWLRDEIAKFYLGIGGDISMLYRYI